jgi:hypothetical protein
MTRLPEIVGAAHAAAWGISHTRLLTLSDPVELAVERAVVNEAISVCIGNEEAKASQVGNAVAKAFG